MNEQTNWRPLTQQEIDALTRTGCTASNWQQVRVTDPFKPDRIQNSHFSGEVQIGLLSGVVQLEAGLEMNCGIYHSAISNCTIGYNTLIYNVSALANMTIADHVVLQNVGSITTEGITAFGNGIGAAVVNENGGRAIPIFEGLTAQVAYLLAMYRHQPQLLNKLQSLIFERVSQNESDRGRVDAETRIQHCGILKNVKIGAGAILEGVSKLENGSIVSDPKSPAYIGPGVVAKDFIVAEGARLCDHVVLNRCYAGQGVRLEKGFSATDSVFFANSHFEQGEACSVFAGPFTVSHHKATLLIAGMFSFYNAGSGTNQSNHMYKLGPVHQGILERGCKTGSDSYLLWPVRLGAFSTVIGKHSKKADLSDLPFSCLLQRHGKSELFPALNLANVGLVRDEKKWPARDNRKAPAAADQVNCAVLTPYAAGAIIAGIERLGQLQQKHPDSDHALYAGIQISAIRRGTELYELALDKYFGDVFVQRIATLMNAEQDHFANASLSERFASLGQLLARKVDLGVCDWADIAGLLTPKSALNELLEDIQAARLGGLADIQMRLEAMHSNYSEYEWAWVLNQLEGRQGRLLMEWSKDDFCTVLEKGLRANEQLTAMQIEDAGKEFVPAARIGYGIDGTSEDQANDFEAVCGTLETNKTVKMLKIMLEEKTEQYQQVLSQLCHNQ